MQKTRNGPGRSWNFWPKNAHADTLPGPGKIKISDRFGPGGPLIPGNLDERKAQNGHWVTNREDWRMHARINYVMPYSIRSWEFGSQL